MKETRDMYARNDGGTLTLRVPVSEEERREIRREAAERKHRLAMDGKVRQFRSPSTKELYGEVVVIPAGATIEIPESIVGVIKAEHERGALKQVRLLFARQANTDDYEIRPAGHVPEHGSQADHGTLSVEAVEHGTDQAEILAREAAELAKVAEKAGPPDPSKDVLRFVCEADGESFPTQAALERHLQIINRDAEASEETSA